MLATIVGAMQASAAVILVPVEVLDNYKRLVAGRAPAGIRDFRGLGSSREVVEVILLLQALDAGGYSQEIRLRTSPGVGETLRALASGQAHLSGTTFWKDDLQKFKPRINPSFSLFRDSEYQVGLYGCRGRVGAASEVDLASLTLVADRLHTVQWSALQGAGFKSLTSAESWLTRVRMVCLGRVDATVADFPASSSLTIEGGGFGLEAYPGIKLIIAASRHYAISSAASRSESVALSLNRGLKIVRRKGIVRRAMAHSGFHHPKASDWREVVLAPAEE